MITEVDAKVGLQRAMSRSRQTEEPETRTLAGAAQWYAKASAAAVPTDDIDAMRFADLFCGIDIGIEIARAEQARLVVGDAMNGERRPEASDG